MINDSHIEFIRSHKKMFFGEEPVTDMYLMRRCLQDAYDDDHLPFSIEKGAGYIIVSSTYKPKENDVGQLLSEFVSPDNNPNISYFRSEVLISAVSDQSFVFFDGRFYFSNLRADQDTNKLERYVQGKLYCVGWKPITVKITP